MSNPLVTCMCLTRNRREWLPKAIACFLAQVYAPKELLIVADSEQDIEGLIPCDGRIHFFVSKERLNVGAKRNLACEAAAGDIVAHWDDDDYSDPQRLVYQVSQLALTGKAVTGFHSMKFTDGAKWWQYRGTPSFALGTSLCYDREWWKIHRFAPEQCGQDEQLAMIAASRQQLSSIGDADLMYATIHPDNTSPRATGAGCYTPLPGYRWRGVERGIV